MIAGPSGVGKGTVIQQVLERLPRLRLSVSATTRPPRPNEQDGVDYLFVSDDEFASLARTGGLLEWAEVFGHRYGTPLREVERALDAGHDLVLEIDVQGAHQVRERMPSAMLILIVPPSMEELERRLRSRATEDEDDVARRLEKVSWELQQEPWFDHVVVNDDAGRATDEVVAILQGFPDTTEGRTHP